MSLVVTVRISGDDRVKAKMKRLGKDLHDFSGAMKEIGKKGEAYFAGPAMLSQGGVFGNKWPRLQSEYAARKAKRYPGRGPMVKTGKLQNSFYFDASKNSVIISNKADHFKYHQSSAPRTRLPRRQMIGVNNTFKTIVRDAIQSDVRDKLRKA